MKNKTARGFSFYDFEDIYGHKYSIQKSSLADKDAIWFGIDDPCPRILASQTKEGGTGWVDYPMPDNVLITGRMHLDQKQVKELLPILQKFVETGEI